MTRLKTFVLLLLLALSVVAIPVAMATDEPEPAVTTAEPTDPDMQPAVVVGDAETAGEEEAWTFRFLVPTVLAVAVVGVVITLLVYGIRVRGRYRVVR